MKDLLIDKDRAKEINKFSKRRERVSHGILQGQDYADWIYLDGKP